MPRANRYHISGCVWHITHRCHKQEYNQRKKRKGAFWEDRYHATAVATDKHLAKCLVYIDLNMVRAGVVTHPSEYGLSGFNEIQKPPNRGDRSINFLDLFAVASEEYFVEEHRHWVEKQLQEDDLRRKDL